MSETISYKELADRLGDVFLFNKAPELDSEIWDGLENGTPFLSDVSEDEDTEYKEVYQWYLIKESDADYLKRNTDELIFYSDVLDEYLWGVTHFGTPWESVTLEFGKPEEELFNKHEALRREIG